jgi:hypothetical protein
MRPIAVLGVVVVLVLWVWFEHEDESEDDVPLGGPARSSACLGASPGRGRKTVSFGG